MANLSTSEIVPGARAPIVGPKWSPSQFDHLKLPSGATIGATDNDTLRRELSRLGVAGAHTDGRHIIIDRYAAMLKKIHDDAGSAAVSAWLQANKKAP